MPLNRHPHISALQLVHRRDHQTGKKEKVLVVETDVAIPRAGQECEDANLYMVLRQLAHLREQVEGAYGEFDTVEIRNVNDNKRPAEMHH